MGQIEKFIEGAEFDGASAAYVRQQVKLALKAIGALEKLGGEVEAQGLIAVGSAITARITELRKDGRK